MKRVSTALVVLAVFVAALTLAPVPGLARDPVLSRYTGDGLEYTLPVRPIEDMLVPGESPEPPRKPVPPFGTR